VPLKSFSPDQLLVVLALAAAAGAAILCRFIVF
jgi:hypothetical protein